MAKAISLNEIEQIFAVTDALGISREALVIPLRTETPARMRLLGGDKLEIVVERDGEFADWLNGLEERIRALMNLPAAD